MVFHDEEEKDKEGAVSEEALAEVLDEDEDEDLPADVPEEEKDWV